MNLRTIAICIAALALTVSALAQAEGAAGQGSQLLVAASSGMPGSLQVLLRADVQYDLKLTQTQKSRIETIRQKEGQAIAASAGKKVNPPVSRKDLEQRIAEDNRQAENVLTDDQKKRLQEIKLQLRGSTAILDPDVQKELDITEGQKAQIQDLRVQQTSQIRAQMQSGEFRRSKMSVIVRKLRTQLSASLIKLLTPDQTAKLKEMTGKPFQIQQPSGRG